MATFDEKVSGRLRKAAKEGASPPEKADTELGETLTSARAYRDTPDLETLREQNDMRREENRHKEAFAQVGWLTRCFGGKENAPVNIAAITVLLSFLLTALCMIAAFKAPTVQQFWQDWSKLIFGIAGTALGFIFGRQK